VVVAPFTLAGANTPASATATVAELTAEALVAIAYAQLERPGTPMIFGSFLAAVSMKSGAPMAGTAELGLMNLMIGQLARRYRLPWRSSGMLTGSKIPDTQAAYEAAFNMYPIMLAGANYVMHCAGWTEAGLTASFAKFMLDAEQIEMLTKLLEGPRFEDFDEAIATIGQVGPGGHFLGTEHTQAHFRDAFFMADLFDNNSFEQWQADGSKPAEQRGLEAARRALDAYVAPPIDEGADEALRDFVARRERELPDSAD
jgi:trimethylamine--corrinoid protein Co-methyltransferase